MNKQMTEQELIDEAIRLLQAARDGKVIECRCREGGPWGTRQLHNGQGYLYGLDFHHYEYRIRLEPPVRWVVRFSDGGENSYRDEAAALRLKKSFPDATLFKLTGEEVK